MAWSGYVALGTISGTTFTELATSDYARQVWNFGSPASSAVVGTDAIVTFPTVTAGTAWSFNALGFFAAVSGGSVMVVFPTTSTQTASPGSAYKLYPARIGLKYLDLTTLHGVALPVTTSISTITGITVGGSGGSIDIGSLPTALPGAAGVLWNNGGVLAVS